MNTYISRTASFTLPADREKLEKLDSIIKEEGTPTKAIHKLIVEYDDQTIKKLQSQIDLLSGIIQEQNTRLKEMLEALQ